MTAAVLEAAIEAVKLFTGVSILIVGLCKYKTNFVIHREVCDENYNISSAIIIPANN